MSKVSITITLDIPEGVAVDDAFVVLAPDGFVDTDLDVLHG